MIPSITLSNINVYVDRQMGGGALKWKRAFEAFSCSIDPCVGLLNVHKAKKLPLVVQDKEHVWNALLNGTRPSPSVFVYCKQSKTGWWEGLGTQLCISMVSIENTPQVKCFNWC